MFLGNYHRFFQEGRVTLPSKFMGELSGIALKISIGKEGCVLLLPLKKGEGPRNNYKPPDPHGRIFVPSFLAEKAHLRQGEKVIVAGCGNYVEIWNLVRWEQELRKLFEFIQELGAI